MCLLFWNLPPFNMFRAGNSTVSTSKIYTGGDIKCLYSYAQALFVNAVDHLMHYLYPDRQTINWLIMKFSSITVLCRQRIAFYYAIMLFIMMRWLFVVILSCDRINPKNCNAGMLKMVAVAEIVNNTDRLHIDKFIVYIYDLVISQLNSSCSITFCPLYCLYHYYLVDSSFGGHNAAV